MLSVNLPMQITNCVRRTAQAVSETCLQPAAASTGHLPVTDCCNTVQWQAAAGFVTADEKAQHFHLSPAQQMVLTNEYGPDASPMFSAGQRSPMSSPC